MQEILELLKGVPLGGISFAGLVAWAIILIFRGDIVPRSTLDAMRTDRDAIIAAKTAECETLREAYRISEEARLTGLEADKELLELGRTTVHLLQSIHEKANGVTS